MNGLWIPSERVRALAEEETGAHRVWSGRGGWIERFGPDFLISAEDGVTGRGWIESLKDWAAKAGGEVRRIFLRRLVKQPKEDDRPVLVFGPDSLPLVDVVAERGLKFEVDFSAGYSVGLFCDQRANRARIASLRPRRMLNTFAYTCAFSVAAARAGAETLSVDLSKRSLVRGRRNFALNGLEAGQRFIADDVFAVLPRLARRGERFDAIVMDPPTFSRGGGGRVFRAERDFGRLFELALGVAAPGARILLSANARTLTVADLREVVRSVDGGVRFEDASVPEEYPVGSAAVAVWAVVGSDGRIIDPSLPTTDGGDRRW